MEKRLLSSLLGLSLIISAVSSEAAPGDLDPGFGLDGRAQTDLGNADDDVALDFALQADGKIVGGGVAGTSGVATSALIRFLPDGSLDPDFNGDGRALFDLSGEQEVIAGVEVLADQSLLACGVRDANPDPSTQDLETFLLKVKPNGDPDLDFGTGGLITESLGGLFTLGADCLAQSDGKHVLFFALIDPTAQTSELIGARYLEDGTPDASFGTNGKKTIALSLPFLPSRTLQRPDGKVLVAGAMFDIATFASQAALVLLKQDGDPDPAFGTAGEAILNVGAGLRSNFREAGLQSDGRIVAGGSYINGVEGDFLIARFTENGILDTGFGPNIQGFEHTDISSGSSDGGSSLIVQSDDRILLAGFDGQDMAVARYLPDGRLDDAASFSEDGLLTVDFPDALEDDVAKVLLQGDGKILLGGNAVTAAEGKNVALVRLLADQGDLKVGIVAGEPEIRLNDQATWTITVTNSGTADASGVVVSSNAPEELAFASASPGQGSCNEELPLECQIGTLAAGSETAIELTTSAVDVSNSIELTVSVRGAIDEVSPADNESTATIAVDSGGGGCHLVR
jgi:uncharacterized delta-60 repeat protein/uncharacterized repeat protein (TIGR01451 family)